MLHCIEHLVVSHKFDTSSHAGLFTQFIVLEKK